MEPARQQEFDKEELNLEFALFELVTALDALREVEDPERLHRAIQAHRRLGAVNARLVKLLAEELVRIEEELEVTVPTSEDV